MKINIIIQGLDEHIQKMTQFPKKVEETTNETMLASLYTLQESVPAYPPPPEGSTYRRTGQLGRSLGVTQTGEPAGQPNIFEVKKEGGFVIGEFGSNLEYAEKVIGDSATPTLDEYIFGGSDFSWWWKIKDVATAAEAKIERLWTITAQRLADWLNKV